MKMNTPRKNDFVPYESVHVGFESLYTGETVLPASSEMDIFFHNALDDAGNVFMIYSCWGFEHTKEADWNDEIRWINDMQQKLGHLDDATRRIRVHIASLVCCDSGVPVTIDEILNAIGSGEIPEPSFHPGCWMSLGTRTTQPLQTESMQLIEQVLLTYLAGETKESLVETYPFARGFIKRTFEWLGPVGDLSEIQKLMLERLLLLFDFLTGRSKDYGSLDEICFGLNGRGAAIDAQIAQLAGLPPIFANYKPEYKENLESISDPNKRNQYEICGAMTHGLHGLSDCHHSTFRWLESWIHGIGKHSLHIPGRVAGVEAQRLGRLLFGYALGIDRWLQGVPMQWLLLDLGHIDLGFDPKNEILRVYAYLGEKTPVKEWLAACLWYTLVLEPPASLYHWGHRHKGLVEAAENKGYSVREWMDQRLMVRNQRIIPEG